jgi:hypothetical protein
MKTWCIKKLGGYTKKEYQNKDNLRSRVEICERIKELNTLFRMCIVGYKDIETLQVQKNIANEITILNWVLKEADK